MPVPIPRAHVRRCLLPEDDHFRRAWREGIDALPVPDRRGRLPVSTGTIAEAVTTLLLTDLGLDVFWQLTAPGLHGVDLLALTPDAEPLAIEVKGTLRAGSIPRFARGQNRQLSIEWLTRENPAMVEFGFTADDVIGTLAVLDFARNTWRAALSVDHTAFSPVDSVDALLGARRAWR